jgi:hypothetical protein
VRRGKRRSTANRSQHCVSGDPLVR